MKLTETKDIKQWNDFVESSPHSHPFQLSSWADIKARNGWQSYRFVDERDGAVIAGAQMLMLEAPLIGYKLAYIPRGPLVKSDDCDLDKLLEGLSEAAKSKGATLLKIEPAFTKYEPPRPWRRAKQQILHPETSVIDLRNQSTEEILKNLKSGTRRDIRKSQRQELEVVTVSSDADFDKMLKLYKATAKRAGFNLYADDYYREVFSRLADNNIIWIAQNKQGEPAAFLWAAHGGDTAIYLYGGSNTLGRDTYANYLLQWHAICHYHEAGISYYDLNGHVSDGVGSFKSKFTDNKVTYIGSFDIPLKKFSYTLWENTLPRLKPILHFIKSKIRR